MLLADAHRAGLQSLGRYPLALTQRNVRLLRQASVIRVRTNPEGACSASKQPHCQPSCELISHARASSIPLAGSLSIMALATTLEANNIHLTTLSPFSSLQPVGTGAPQSQKAGLGLLGSFDQLYVAVRLRTNSLILRASSSIRLSSVRFCPQ